MSSWSPSVVIAVLAVALALPAGARAETIPPPDADPFYAVPSGLEAQAEGTVLRSREVTVTLRGLPVPVKSWQLLYRSNDSKGRPIAAVATVLVPLTPYSGRRPLVSYQAAIDSLGSHCNPSYTLRTGTQKELVSLVPLIAAGWAVVVPDFEGPRNAYGAGLVAGRTVLDGIRAAERFAPAELAGTDTPVGLWGYSGGGQASAWAAEQQPVYAPELSVEAVAAGGVPPDLEQVARQIDGGLFFGIYAAVAVGLSREFPEVDIDALLNERGQALKERIGTECADELVLGYPMQRMSDYTTAPDPLAVPRVRDVIAANRLGEATPTAPLFIYHSVLDELIPVVGPDALVSKYCAEGATLYYQRDVTGEHIAYAVTGGALAFTYLAARFAGPRRRAPAARRPGTRRRPRARRMPAPRAARSPCGCAAAAASASAASWRPRAAGGWPAGAAGTCARSASAGSGRVATRSACGSAATAAPAPSRFGARSAAADRRPPRERPPLASGRLALRSTAAVDAAGSG